jgi:chromosome segregation ATPase
MTSPGKSPDKRLEWLDEQRRKDSEALARLAEKLSALEGALASHSRQGQDLASEVTKLSTQVSRIQRFDEALDKHRKDTTQRLATAQKRQLDRQHDLESLWKADQKQVGKSLDELRAELAALEDLRMGFAARQEEAARIRKDLDAANARIERLSEESRERGRAWAGLEEARGQESKRLAELQAGHTELRKSVDTLKGRADVLEDAARKLERHGEELETAQEELREGQRLWSEAQAAQLAEFARRWKDWERQFQQFEHQADQLNQRMLAYEETFRAVQQLKGQLEQVLQRLERRITEVSELQRLAEDRLKQDWIAFKADDQKRWSGLQLAEDERWKDHERRHDRMDQRLGEQHDTLANLVQEVGESSESGRRRLMEALSMLREWAAEVERRIETAR